MHLIGRWERVRRLDLPSRQISPPYLVDKKWGEFKAFRHEEWWRSPEGLWLPTMRGEAGLHSSRTPWARPFFGMWPETNQQGLSQLVGLQSNYVAGTSGHAIGARIMTPVNETINDLYFYLNSYSGTAANVNDLDWEIRNQNGTTFSLPDTSGAALSSGSFNPSSATKWIKITGISQALTAGTHYWFIVGDADGNGTHFALPFVAWAGIGYFPYEFGWGGLYTTNGWQGAGTPAGVAAWVANCASGDVYGMPWEGEEAPTNGTYERGLLVDDLGGSLRILAICGTASGVGGQAAGARIWEGTSGPTGTPLYASTSPVGYSSSQNAKVGGLFPSFVVVNGGTQYRFTITFSSSSSTPLRVYIGTSADATLRAAMPGGGGWMWTQDTASAWVNTNDKFPKLAVFIEDFSPVGSTLAGSIARGMIAR